MKLRRALAIAALPLMVIACRGPATSRDDEGEARRLMETSREWSQVAEKGDLDGLMSYFTEDAVMLSESQKPVRGRDAIRSYLGETLKTPGFKIRWEPIEAHVSGDMGYLIERTEVTVTGAQGQPVTQNLQGLTIWRKQPDGSWKNAVDMSASSAPDARP